MATFNTSFRKKIIDILDKSHYGSANFDLVKLDARPLCIEIRFLPKVEYFFGVLANQFNPEWAEVKMTPGALHSEQTHTMKNCDGLLDHIENWSVYLEEEMRANTPIYRELEEFKRSVQEKFGSLDTKVEQSFSREEARELRVLIEQLKQKYGEQAQEIGLLEEEISKIQEEFRKMREDVGTMGKVTFVRTALGRLGGLTKYGIPIQSAMHLVTATQHLLTGSTTPPSSPN